MRIPVLAAAICLFALAGCEQSYSSTRTVTESGGEVVERTVEVQIGGRREPSTAERSGTTPEATIAVGEPAPGQGGAAAGENATPAAADTPVASEG